MNKAAILFIPAYCNSTFTDMQLLRSFFRLNKWRICKKIEYCDLAVVFTCGVAREMEDLSKQLIQDTRKRLKKGAGLIVTGCLPKINKKALNKVYKGEIIFPGAWDGFNHLVNAETRIQDVLSTDTLSAAKKGAGKYYLRIGCGCLGNCAYCAIKNVFGRPRSRPISDIRAEFEAALHKGYRNFFLVSNDVGSYGVDINSNLPQLLGAITEYESGCSFGLSLLNPDRLQELWPDCRRFIASGKISYIKLPVQSASNRILKLMRRNYTVEIFKDCIKKLFKANRDLTILTSLIIGLPQETESDFREQLRLISWIRRGNYRVNFDFKKFSPRPNTQAPKMPGQVPEEIRQRRLAQIESFNELSSIFKNKDRLAGIISLK